MSAKVYPSMALLLVRQLRIHQWTKNLLVVVPFLLAHDLSDPETITRAVYAFLAISFIASAVYTLNDLVDRRHDAEHPTKRHRPLASGALSVSQAIVVMVGLLTVASPLALLTRSSEFLVFLLIYVATTTAYSFWLKKIVLVDVLTLAGLYTLRIVAGGAVTQTSISRWLLMFSLFVFTSLAFLKRYTELLDTVEREGRIIMGRGYRVGDAQFVFMAGIATGLLAVLVFAFYLSGDDVLLLYARPERLWAMVPIVLFWITHMWLKAHRGEMHEDPIYFALRDRISYVVAALAIAIVLSAQP